MGTKTMDEFIEMVWWPAGPNNLFQKSMEALHLITNYLVRALSLMLQNKIRIYVKLASVNTAATKNSIMTTIMSTREI